MRQAYSDDEGIPAEVEEERLREAEQQVTEEMEIEDTLVMANNIGTGSLKAQRAVMAMFPNAKVLHARINQETGEVER